MEKNKIVGMLKAMVFCIEGMTCHLSQYGESAKDYIKVQKDVKELKKAIKMMEEPKNEEIRNGEKNGN